MARSSWAAAVRYVGALQRLCAAHRRNILKIRNSRSRTGKLLGSRRLAQTLLTAQRKFSELQTINSLRARRTSDSIDPQHTTTPIRRNSDWCHPWKSDRTKDFTNESPKIKEDLSQPPLLYISHVSSNTSEVHSTEDDKLDQESICSSLVLDSSDPLVSRLESVRLVLREYATLFEALSKRGEVRHYSSHLKPRRRWRHKLTGRAVKPTNSPTLSPSPSYNLGPSESVLHSERRSSDYMNFKEEDHQKSSIQSLSTETIEKRLEVIEGWSK